MKKIIDSDIKVILWDFDGVLLESNSVRGDGFMEVLKAFPPEQLDVLMDFHNINGGLSRYVKFRYFFENIRGEEISDIQVQEYVEKFSKIMRCQLSDIKRLIAETNDFVKKIHKNFIMHIVSGSDQEELRYLCKILGIDEYFKSIQGSPVHKNDLVRNLIQQYEFDLSEYVLIGDSINDYDAAIYNNIKFISYNNPDIQHLSDPTLILF
jgi:phosphoglycolate phosphatase-like HAD superfamily hydrolase